MRRDNSWEKLFHNLTSIYERFKYATLFFTKTELKGFNLSHAAHLQFL